ncbi:hypothetical protein BDR04DRAFT_1123399, partial [Suillus decipiens]
MCSPTLGKSDPATVSAESGNTETQMRSPSPIDTQMSTIGEASRNLSDVPHVYHQRNGFPIPQEQSPPGPINNCHDMSVPLEKSLGLLHDSYLQTLNLAVNEQFRFLCCELCQTAVLVEQAQSHTRKHPGLKFDLTRFKEAIATVGVVDRLPNVSSGTAPIHGLSIHDAFACCHCDKVLLSEKKIREHSTLNHKEFPMPHAWRACRAQRFQSGGGQPGHQLLWEVDDSHIHSTTSVDKIVADVLDKIAEELVVPQIPQDDRMISPWLLTTRWHESMGTHPTEELRQMVAMPQDRDGMQRLKYSVEVYFENALALIPTTDELTLQRLNSPDPVKFGISNTPLHKHQQPETMQRYLLPIISLLAMLIRNDTNYPYHIPMPDHIEQLLDDLDLSVAQDSQSDQGAITYNIHRIFMCLWQTKWERTDTNPIPDPTERCLALLTLQRDGSFKEPKDVTGIIAKDEYCMRLAFLREIRNRVASGEAEDESVAFHDLEPYLTEKNHFTFSRLRSLQHRASALAYDTMSLPRLLWIDGSTWRTMLYKGNRVDLDDVCIRQGEIVWNKATLRTWLQDYADFHSLLLLRCEMLSGAPGRGTELTAMTYRNTRTRPTRNLVILGKHITMLCLYCKTSALTGKDKLIPHSLDAVTGDILIQDLALARPFAEFAASICFPNHAEVLQLYRQHILPFLNYGLTINSWRHIQTAWKHEDAEDTIDALQAGHSRATENRVYGLSVQALAGAAEDVLPLFLNASTAWQTRCKTVPGGTLLPYKKARSGDNNLPSFTPDSQVDAGAPPQFSLEQSTANIARTVLQHLMPTLTTVIQSAVRDALASSPDSNRAIANQFQLEDKEVREEISDTCQLESFEPEKSQGIVIPDDMMITDPDTLVSSDFSNANGLARMDASSNNIPDNALHAMKRLFQDQTVAWASRQQQQAMGAVLEKETDVVAILRTGGGKSMLAIIPSIVETFSATVLVLPLNSLVIDFEHRLKRMGVPFQIYDRSINNGRLNPRDNLILVTADKCRTDGWRESIAILNEQKPIARFVFDEAHLPLIARDYRDALDYIYDIRSLPVQM